MHKTNAIQDMVQAIDTIMVHHSMPGCYKQFSL